MTHDELTEIATSLASPLALDEFNRRFTLLAPSIDRQARIKAKTSKFDPDDFAQTAAIHVCGKLQQGKFDASLASFPTWLNRVVTHLAIDWFRRNARHRERDVVDASVADPDESPAAVAARDWAITSKSLFTDDDLARIERWAPQKRVWILCLFPWFGRVPRERWESWLRDVGLAAPFPPEWWFSLDELAERISALAELVGESPAYVSKFWHRRQHLLLDLAAFWDWCGSSFPPLDDDTSRRLGELPAWSRVVVLAISRDWARLGRRETWFEWLAEAGLREPLRLLTMGRRQDLDQVCAELDHHAKTHGARPPYARSAEIWRRWLETSSSRRLDE